MDTLWRRDFSGDSENALDGRTGPDISEQRSAGGDVGARSTSVADDVGVFDPCCADGHARPFLSASKRQQLRIGRVVGEVLRVSELVAPRPFDDLAEDGGLGHGTL